jgi:hypothetical protein
LSFSGKVTQKKDRSWLGTKIAKLCHNLTLGEMV